jgi:hypothetical protein
MSPAILVTAGPAARRSAIAVTVGFAIVIAKKLGHTRQFLARLVRLVDYVALARSDLNWGILWTCLRLKDETYASLKRLARYVSGLTIRS